MDVLRGRGPSASVVGSIGPASPTALPFGEHPKGHSDPKGHAHPKGDPDATGHAQPARDADATGDSESQRSTRGAEPHFAASDPAFAIAHGPAGADTDGTLIGHDSESYADPRYDSDALSRSNPFASIDPEFDSQQFAGANRTDARVPGSFRNLLPAEPNSGAARGRQLVNTIRSQWVRPQHRLVRFGGSRDLDQSVPTEHAPVRAPCALQ